VGQKVNAWWTCCILSKLVAGNVSICLCGRVSAWIEKPFENWPNFMKIEEIGLDWFHRFSVNRQSNLNFLKI
jgi:hypothetical protein